MSDSQNGTASTATITFISNQGNGRPQQITAEGPMELGDFLSRVLNGNGKDFKVRINGQPAGEGAQVSPGDTVVATPSKIQGA